MSGRGTLDGSVVVVTRPREQAASLVTMLEERGATPILAPAISIEPADPTVLGRAAARVAAGEFEWVVLTSRAGAEALLDAIPVDSRVRAHVAAVGDGTARALRERGVEPDLIPRTFTTAALGDAMPTGAGRVLLARADIAPGELEEIIASRGWRTERVDAYRTRSVRDLPAEAANALRSGAVDAVTFTSASAVRGFLDAARTSGVDADPSLTVVCIGPVTARAAADAGMPVAAVASPHTIEGLVEALEGALGAAERTEP